MSQIEIEQESVVWQIPLPDKVIINNFLPEEYFYIAILAISFMYSVFLLKSKPQNPSR
jgi:hypothetical protein